MTSFRGIHTALSAVLAHRRAIDIVNHNVANANTPGYRRQMAVLAPGPAYEVPGLHAAGGAGQFGTGVRLEQIRRFTLDFFDGRYRRALAEAGRYDVQRGALKQVEAVLSETAADGLTARLDAFFAGWQALSADPANQALRAELRERAGAVVEAFNRRAIALQQQRADQDLNLRQRVEEVNRTAAQIARLNGQIANVLSVGQQPNDLLDERDRLADRLAELAGATTTVAPNGVMSVSINSHALVIGSETFRLQTAPNPANGNLLAITWEDGQTFNPLRGEIAGLLEVRDAHLVSQLSGLNTLAQTFIAQVNAQHNAGYRLNSAVTGGDFFEPATDPSGQYALSIRLSANITASLGNIAAASQPNAPGDGTNAVALARLQQALTMSGGTASFGGFYSAQIGQLALDTRQAENGYRDRRSVLGALNQQRDAVSGVSLDEEAANLMQSQKAYEAAARLMTAVDEMLDRVINGMGRVGL
jgi:flagellar hook-associated protein 1 FlgK